MDKATEILSDLTVFTKYAKFVPENKRRETWGEIVWRNMFMHIEKYPDLTTEIYNTYMDFVMPKKVLPSMRSLQFGGHPIFKAPNRIFNCAYLPTEKSSAFQEVMFLLLGGSGAGYSVQKHHVNKLPAIKGPSKHERRFLIGDSIEGWADSVKVLVEAYFYGKVRPRFDFSDIRPKGAELVTSGGQAPGPDPLRACLKELEAILDRVIKLRGSGTKLKPIEVHDMMCVIADAVLAGGIRRAALICLFDRDDEEMLNAKGKLPVDILSFHPVEDEDGMYFVELLDKSKGVQRNVKLHAAALEPACDTGVLDWFNLEPQRGRANNSAVLPRGEVTEGEFYELMLQVEASGAGEPGVYWTNDVNWGTNPCCEIALRPYQFCNLTEINASDIVDQDDLNARARAASFIGTLQAGYTDFHYLSPEWKEATEKDALIGVGMTGIASGAVLNLNLDEAARIVLDVNADTAHRIGINKAARTTTVKPSGTSSLVAGSSSGIHAWHNDFYIRRMRLGKNEAIYGYLAEYHPELVEDENFRPDTQAVVSVPQRAPVGSILRTESMQDLLDRVSRFNNEWVRTGHRDGKNSHNVSCTISVHDGDWNSLARWMWDKRDEYNGISVLPYMGGTYQQAPFEDITEEQFHEMSKHLSHIDLTKVHEEKDNTDLSGEIACGSDGCEIQ